MGFPVCYSELPNVVLHLLFLLAHLRRLINWTCLLFGLGRHLDDENQWQDVSIHSHQDQQHQQQVLLQGLFSVSAELIKESLPEIQFRDLLNSGSQHGLPESCAVCLYEFEGSDKVRRMSNCCHVFHRQCVDRWLEHGQRTCPLCRAQLIPEELQDRVQTEASMDGSSSGDDHHYYTAFSSPSASMLRPLQFPSS